MNKLSREAYREAAAMLDTLSGVLQYVAPAIRRSIGTEKT